MVAVVVGVIALVVVFAIAAAVVGRETHRLVDEAPRPVFDLDEAVEWVAAHLPFEVAAELSHDDVRQMLTWSLEHLATVTPTGNGHGPRSGGPAVVATGETVDHVLGRARSVDLECTVHQVHAVIVAELAYLQVIGAMGPPEDRLPDDR
jgi:hypothetical protein